jgi:ribosomal protein S25
MDKLLTHIRASQEARAAKRNSGGDEKEEQYNNVFVDEETIAWWGNEPL